MIDKMIDKLLLILRDLRNSRVWLSIFRRGHLPRTEADYLAMNRRNFWVHVLPAKINRRSVKFSYNWMWMGVVTFWLFIILVLSGVFLMFYYVPSIERAFDSVLTIVNAVSFGRFMRNLHKWTGELMILAAFLHMLAVFFKGAYQEPREFNWIIGVLLLLITIFFGFSGYILPWDQLGYYAAAIAANIADGTPFIGKFVKSILLGGGQLDQPTLLRWYVIHVFILPTALLLLLGVHFWRIRKDGYSVPPPPEEDE